MICLRNLLSELSLQHNNTVCVEDFNMNLLDLVDPIHKKKGFSTRFARSKQEAIKKLFIHSCSVIDIKWVQLHVLFETSLISQ